MKENKSVLPENRVSFIIVRCDLDITVDNDFKYGNYKMHFILKKINEGDDTWTVTSHFKSDEFEIDKVKNDDNGNLRTQEIHRDDSKACHRIFFDKVNLNQDYKFTITYKERLSSTRLNEGYFLFKRHFISLVKIFPNQCNLLNLNVNFKRKRINIIAANPNDSIKDKKLSIENKNISPFEHTTLSFIVSSGILLNSKAILIEKLFWSSGIIAWIVKLIIEIFKNGNN